MVAAGYATFPCAHCGAALPATFAAGMVIACPRCAQRIVVPAGGGPTLAQAQQYQAWHMVHGNTAAALSDRRDVFASTTRPVVVDDGAGGVVMVGAQVDDGGRWHVRGVDPATRQVRWEVLHGSYFRTAPEIRSVCARAGRIYFAHEGMLASIEAGRVRWQARLPGRIKADVDRAPLAGDEVCLDVAADVVIARTDEDGALHAYDRETGALRWQRRAEAHPQCDGSAVYLREGYRQLDLVDPRSGQTIRRFDGSEGALAGGALALTVSRDDHDGIALVDTATGQERWFVRADNVTLDPGVASVGDDLVFAVDGAKLLAIPRTGAARRGLLSRLFGGGAATHALPWRDFTIDALRPAGDAVAIVLESGDARRFAIVDPRTMAVRHDSGAVADGITAGMRIGPGLLAYVFAGSEGPKTLRMVDIATGQLRWERSFPELDDIAFRGGRLVLRIDNHPIEIVDPATGR